MTKIALFMTVCASVLAAGAYDLANPALNPVEIGTPVAKAKAWPLFVKGREQFVVLAGPGGDGAEGPRPAARRQAFCGSAGPGGHAGGKDRD